MSTNKRIAVVGSTGRVGAPLAEILEERGHEVVRISRAQGVDVATGDGLREALEGVDVIVDVASTPSPDERAATEFFTTSARNLQEAGQRAGVAHIVAVSIIGIDDFQGGYNAAKVAQERALKAGPIPVSILRAAQFHEFVETMLSWVRQGDALYVPEMLTQLVAARSVAAALADLAEGPIPADAPITEIAGPRAERLADVARKVVEAGDERLTVEEARNPDDPDAARFADGALLPGPGATLAGPTFEDWFAATRVAA